MSESNSCKKNDYDWLHQRDFSWLRCIMCGNKAHTKRIVDRVLGICDECGSCFIVCDFQHDDLFLRRIAALYESCEGFQERMERWRSAYFRDAWMRPEVEVPDDYTPPKPWDWLEPKFKQPRLVKG